MNGENMSSDESEVWNCGMCPNKVNYGEMGLQCEELMCAKWFHTACLEMGDEEYRMLKKNQRIKWYCDGCKRTKGEEESAKMGSLEEPSENTHTGGSEAEEISPVRAVTTRSKQRRKTVAAKSTQKKAASNTPGGNFQVTYSFITEMVKDRVTEEVDKRMLEIKNERMQEDKDKEEERADLKRKICELGLKVQQLSKRNRNHEPSVHMDLELEEISEAEEEEMPTEEAIPEYLEEMEGDIFKVKDPMVALCNCVGSDFWMTDGVAADFKDEFGGQDDLLAQEKGVGQVAVLKKYDRVLYYLVSKEKSIGKPKLADLVLCLHDLKKMCIEDGVRQIAMPRIGAGLDNLVWADVKKEINKAFLDSDIKVTVYKRPAEMAVVVGDSSLSEVWTEIQGAVSLVDACRSSSLQSMLQLVQDAPLTEDTQEVVIYLGTCVASDAMDRGQAEVKSELKTLIRAAKNKLTGKRRLRIKVVGAVPHSGIHREVVRNVNKMIFDVCKEESVRFRNPIKPFSDQVSWGVKGWDQEKAVVAKTVGGYINSLLDC